MTIYGRLMAPLTLNRDLNWEEGYPTLLLVCEALLAYINQNEKHQSIFFAAV